MKDKKVLRKEIVEKRKKISNKEKLDNLIKNNLLKNEVILKSQNILVYLSKEYEVDTYKIIEELFKINKNIYAPRVIDNTMEFYKLENLDNIKLGKYNIYEPTSNIKFKNNVSSCMIVPGLLFDKSNNRLGYGGGYYDKYLSNLDIYKIGICYSCFLINKIDTENHDIKMDLVITER